MVCIPPSSPTLANLNATIALRDREYAAGSGGGVFILASRGVSSLPSDIVCVLCVAWCLPLGSAVLLCCDVIPCEGNSFAQHSP